MRERFDYLIETRNKFLDTFQQIGWDEFTKDRGASWGSMLGIFLHILDDEEGWLQHGAKNGSILDGPDRKTADYQSFAELSNDNSKVSLLTKTYLATLTRTWIDRWISN